LPAGSTEEPKFLPSGADRGSVVFLGQGGRRSPSREKVFSRVEEVAALLELFQEPDRTRKEK
jgi:hypothetical protein